MATSETDWNHPYYKAFEKLSTEKGRLGFFTGKSSHRMQHVSLGELLDFISYGALNYVFWSMDEKGLIGLIRAWMNEQRPRIHYARVPDEKIKDVYNSKETKREHSYLWNRFHRDFDEELPRINLKECPREQKHNGYRVRDLAGNIRCAHKAIEKLKPSFITESRYFDRHSGMKIISYHEEKPYNPLQDDAYDKETGELLPFYKEEFARYKAKRDLFNEEKPTAAVTDICYAIVSENKNNPMPLEKILSRLDCSYKFINREDIFVVPFSGFELAGYVKAWWNQKGEKRFFMKPGQEEGYKVFPDFVPMSSED